MSAAGHLLLLYKGDISALILFCQQASGHVCFPPLPKLSDILPEDEKHAQAVGVHPAVLVKNIIAELHLDADLLAAEPGFYEQVETPNGIVPVYMARFKVLDPPHRIMAEKHCKLQPLTALFGRPPAEMELLRRAYAAQMEG